MTFAGLAQIALVFALVLAAAVPLGCYMAALFDSGRSIGPAPVRWFEAGWYRIAGVDPGREQSWSAYTLSMLAFSVFGFASLYAILRLQAFLPFNPQGFDGLAPDLAFNTAISFLTNTNWQAYSGETTMSHLTQMAGLTVQNFLSAATGIALAIAALLIYPQTAWLKGVDLTSLISG